MLQNHHRFVVNVENLCNITFDTCCDLQQLLYKTGSKIKTQ